MPEGDTVFKVAAALRPYLLSQPVLAARGRAWGPGPGPRMAQLVGSTITAVEPHGKHLIIRFDAGLALHTHLRMTGSWHRYAPDERWRKPPHQAVVVLEVPGSVLVCFNAPIVELIAERAADRLPALATLGPDLLAETFSAEAALTRLRAPSRTHLTLGEALLDQRALAGVGNIFKSEILFIERLSPWATLAETDDATLRQVLATAERLLRLNAVPGTGHRRVTTGGSPLARGSSLWVYGRAGRSCFRCRAPILSRAQGEQARITFWCPRCQPAPQWQAAAPASRNVPPAAGTNDQP